MYNLLTKTVTIEQRTPSKSAIGTPVDTWSNYAANQKAGMRTKSIIRSDAVGKQFVVNLTVFYMPVNDTTAAIESDWRIVCNGTYYEIQTIENVAGMDRILELACLEVDA